MRFKEMLRPLREGKKVRLQTWAGYWQKDGNEILMHCHDGSVINIKDSDNIFWTLENICSEDWEVVDDLEVDFEMI